MCVRLRTIGTAVGAADARLAEGRHGGGLGVAGVEGLVASEVVAGAARAVAARLGDHVDDGVQRRAVLGVELVAEDLELLDGILGHVDDRAAPRRVVDGAAVEDRRVAVALVGEPAELGHREPAVHAGEGRRAGQELGQHQEVAVEHRQHGQLLADDHRLRLCLGHLDQRALAADDDALGQRGDAEREVDGGVGADQQDDRALGRREAGELGGDRVRPGLEIDRPVVALRAGEQHLRGAVVGVDQRDRHAGQRGLASRR